MLTPLHLCTYKLELTKECNQRKETSCEGVTSVSMNQLMGKSCSVDENGFTRY